MPHNNDTSVFMSMCYCMFIHSIQLRNQFVEISNYYLTTDPTREITLDEVSLKRLSTISERCSARFPFHHVVQQWKPLLDLVSN